VVGQFAVTRMLAFHIRSSANKTPGGCINNEKSTMTKTKTKRPSKRKAKSSTCRSKPKLKQKADTAPTSNNPVNMATIFREIILKKLQTAEATGLQKVAIERLPIAWVRTEHALLAAGPGVEPWSQGSVSKPKKAVQDLASLLFQHGGNRAYIPFEEVPLCEAYATLGQLILPKKVKMKRGEERRCHLNSLVQSTMSLGKLSFVTGFGLIEKTGMWHAHSWLTTKSGQIIETTVKRDMYFGVPFDVPDMLPFYKMLLEAGVWKVTAA
jgi:hypothetical protein